MASDGSRFGKRLGEAHALRLGRALRAEPLICGYNGILPAETLGCGKAIESTAHVYRCTECHIQFHHDCAIRHFEAPTDAPADATLTPAPHPGASPATTPEDDR